MTQLASSYDPKTFETALYDAWEKAGHFKPSGKGEPYTILLPPPNVTGTLHMGHAFQQTLMDALVRYHRMRGYDTLWQGGTPVTPSNARCAAWAPPATGRAAPSPWTRSRPKR